MTWFFGAVDMVTIYAAAIVAVHLLGRLDAAIDGDQAMTEEAR